MDTATLDITVTPVADPPLAVITRSWLPRTGQLWWPSDADGDALSVTGVNDTATADADATVAVAIGSVSAVGGAFFPLMLFISAGQSPSPPQSDTDGAESYKYIR